MVLGVAALIAAALVGCTPQTILVAGSEVRVAVSDPFTSLNPATSYGRGSVTNGQLAQLTTTGFAYPDDHYGTVVDGSFGSATLVSRDPLVVTYRVNSGVTWSDGAPVDAADLLLAWAANSGALNTPGFDDSRYVDPATGRYTRSFPKNVVFFDGAIGSGLEKARAAPLVGSDGRSITVTFGSFDPDWKTALDPGVPAHVLGSEALGVAASDPKAGKRAVLDAIEKRDATRLGALARFWNDGFNLDATPKDRRLLVSDGPYTVSRIVADRVTLSANPRYAGDRRPAFAKVTVRVSTDPLETAKLLASRAVDIATVQPSAATVSALGAISGVTVTPGTEARFEHLDLQFADGRNGTFGDARVREAFLKVVPRAQILRQLGSSGGGRATLLDSFSLRPGASGYAASVARNGSAAYRSTDIDTAKRLLAQAGVSNPQVCVLYDPTNPRRVTEFQLIQRSAARAGFVVTDCSSGDWQGLLGVAGAYDAALFAWDTTRLGPAAQSLVFRSGSRLANFNRYSDPKADALIDRAVATDDPATQTSLLSELDARIWAAGYGVPLYAYPTLTAVDDRVTGVTRSPLAGSIFWNAWTWKPAAVTTSHPGGGASPGP